MNASARLIDEWLRIPRYGYGHLRYIHAYTMYIIIIYNYRERYMYGPEIYISFHIIFEQGAIKLPERKLNNLTTDWNDGILVATLVDSIARGLCPECDEMVPSKALQNATQAMKMAEDWIGVLQVKT